jgi:putative endonuclease
MVILPAIASLRFNSPKMPLPSPDSHPQKSQEKSTLGLLGENLVAQWLQDRGWAIIAKRWRCRWGEIDIIAGEIPGEQLPEHPYQRIAFVEVKTRKNRSWDAGGLLSIHPQKQAKLLQTAEIFLSDRPELSNCPCQFDVALVSYQKYQRRSAAPQTTLPNNFSSPITLGQAIFIKNSLGEYQLTLHQYIAGAFDAEIR